MAFPEDLKPNPNISPDVRRQRKGAVLVELGPARYARVKDDARQMNITISAFVRQCIDQYRVQLVQSGLLAPLAYTRLSVDGQIQCDDAEIPMIDDVDVD
jgi:hypothetical protein